ncbi:MAG: type II toxin-antitoxin system HicB family antitoxin [Planctomycetes bacterium]|nr:type II toxin-antitoxin system HicB family antitoxin [Planctomycetota bacterium]
MKKTRQLFTVTDGRLVLELEPAEEGGYVVTSPINPELITEAESVEEAFEMARDALQALAQSRAKLIRSRQKPGRGGRARV